MREQLMADDIKRRWLNDPEYRAWWRDYLRSNAKATHAYHREASYVPRRLTVLPRQRNEAQK